MQTPVPPTAQAAVRVAVATAFVLTGLQVASKSLRDALFCAVFTPSDLPRVMALGAGLAFAVAIGVARIMPRLGPRRIATLLLVLNGFALATEHSFLAQWPREVATAVYLHTSAVTGAIFSGFWSLVSERLDPHAMRSATPRIGLGATLGGLAGGLAAERGVALAGADHALIVLGSLSVGAALLLQVLKSRRSHAPSAPALPLAASSSPYLRSVALLVGLTALSSSIADFALKARAMERFSGVADLVHFFGLFYTATSLLAFVFQALVTQPLIERAGLGAALGGLPAAVAVSALGASLFPGIAAQAVLRGTDATLSASLYRSAYEPLFSPLPAKLRRSAKVLIDVIVDKLGDVMGGFVAWGLVLLVPRGASVWASVVIAPLSLFTLYLAGRVYRGYVDELARSLRAGETALNEADNLDQATALYVSRTFAPIDRARLLEEIRKRREGVQRESMLHDAIVSSTTRDNDARLFRTAEELSSGDATRIRAALETSGKDARLVPFLLPLVERSDVGDAVMRALAAYGDDISGALGDALRQHDVHSSAARRRFARVLSSSASLRAAFELFASLDDPDYHVRHQLSQGIAATQRAGIRLPVEVSYWVSAAKSELLRDDPLPIAERIDAVFTLLGLAYDFESVHLARRAMSAGDLKLRGTALEYLENILPPTLRADLFRALNTVPPPGSRRGEKQLLAELKRTLG